MEDQTVTDPEAGQAAAAELERQAIALGEENLVVRARLLGANMLRRTGDLAGAARQLPDIERWAVEHGDRCLQARTYVAWANVERLFGDTAKFLEYSLSAVELLDDTATPHMQIWYRCTLADALADNGYMDSARPRFQQVEALARELRQWEQLLMVLNNWACSEQEAGDLPQARAVAHRMQEYSTAHGLDLNPGMLDTIGAIQIEHGEYAEAEQVMLECIARFQAGELDHSGQLAEYQLNLARAQHGLGALDRAQVSLDAARELCVEGDLHTLLVRVHQEQAELHAARGDYAAAFAAQKVVFATNEDLQARQQLAEALNRHAMFETAEAREAARQFREQARRDPLTGLRNRRYVDEKLPALLAADPDLSLAIFDIDHFKRINDTLGHDGGDQVLAEVARLLDTHLAAAAATGFAARLGGEEFLLVLPLTPVAAATAKFDTIRRAISEHDWHDTTKGLHITVSVGVAGANETTPRSQTATLAAADRNLYAAKQAGRNRVVTGTEPEPRHRAYRDHAAP
ncbi:diguanylate cyclase [Amorphoplanes digitatis]|uniref:Diguanylate cyclase (GGDEF)-like protein n=1 Tax=Actinoplanes digitatis TaxID=1868 RepID=A0A7W7MNR7_9ACTN|nr:GGDEF domain-containing protein [Actinoplanes digitatis]MBB4760957.1 diguanylate cyclase (GGDEF)-like protein [Actinoplanes digitatis]